MAELPVTSHPFLVPVSLFLKTGELVTIVNVPPFNPPAEILQWGSRFFVLDKETGKYLEGLMFFVPPTMEAGE
jgi:hypothetical protein